MDGALRRISVALERLGGEADLPRIYSELEANRPTQNRWWQDKVRQTLHESKDFVRVRVGRYALAERDERLAA